MIRRYEDREIGGRDPLDRPPAPLPAAGWFRRLLRRLRTNAVLGLPPLIAPALLFVPLGALLGPAALNLLNRTVLARLEPIVSITLATLGVFVGLAISRRQGRGVHLMFAASLESGITVLVVTATAGILINVWEIPLTTPPVILALLLGVSAAASSAGFEETVPSTRMSVAARIADLDDVLPIVAGGFALVALQATSILHGLGLLTATIGLGVVVGVIGMLLIERAHSEAERGLFVIGCFALAGGASSYLGLSALLTGLTAGIVWNWGPGRVDGIVRADMRRYQHPLVVLLLLTAGANVRLTLDALWLCAPFVLFRVSGKVLGGWVASRFAQGIAPGDLGAHLLAPGLIGIAFALGAAPAVGGGDGTALLSATVIGTLVSELVALSVAPAVLDTSGEEPA